MNTLLKNGHHVLIRPVTINDAAKRHAFFVDLSRAQIGVVHTVDEINHHQEESEQHIHDFINYHRGLWLIACNDQENIIGEIDITVKKLARIRHNGSLTMGILTTYRNLGLGSALMHEALLWAQANSLSRIELSVFKANILAQALYKKFGFVIEGIRLNAIKNPDDSFDDDVMMAKYLGR